MSAPIIRGKGLDQGGVYCMAQRGPGLDNPCFHPVFDIVNAGLVRSGAN